MSNFAEKPRIRRENQVLGKIDRGFVISDKKWFRINRWEFWRWTCFLWHCVIGVKTYVMSLFFSLGHESMFFKKVTGDPLILCHYMSGMMCKNFIWFRWKFENPKSIMCFGWSACRIMIHTPPARRNELIYSLLRSLQQLFQMYFSYASQKEDIQT